ncbi:MT-A70 family methyltransferase [Halalkalibacterium ligniniphilum]|uniref:MT-A70 family methyltransferase n=1 Tax=Halalkalibacterium ligniniphilum TaxID=1134413 RepID=UPI00034BBF87|nr:MT-A70 family methyltransferase [Halalkalibacterium ligniniphilum]
MILIIPFPNQKYNVILADPPWSYRQGGRGAAKNHYLTMTTKEIMRLPVQDIAKPDSILFIWGTFPNQSEVEKVIEAWGFTYKTAAFLWVKLVSKGKPCIGGGHYTRANAEPCYVAVGPAFKNKQQIIDRSISQIIFAPRGVHSAKPAEVRERIVKLVGDVPRIELFARERAPGWESWGLEVPV